MSAIDDLPPLRAVVDKFDLAPKKSLGQNFLFDLNITAKIARAAGPLDQATIIEIGPGPGGLTRALLAGGARKVIAIERDSRCIAALQEIAARYPGRLDIREADAMEADYAALASERVEGTAVRIAANLPYNIATVLLAGWLETEPWPPFFDRMILMFQREVALRIVATPQQRADYGRLGVLAGWRTQARILFDLPPAAFTPPPKVTSSVVELIPRQEPVSCNATDLSRVTQAAFGQRRKMLRQSLKGLGVESQKLIEAAGVPETARAEEIGIEGFAALARALARES